MDIQKRLPFDACEHCGEFILKVDEQAILSVDNRIEVVLTVKCKNEHMCRRIKDLLKDEK